MSAVIERPTSLAGASRVNSSVTSCQPKLGRSRQDEDFRAVTLPRLALWLPRFEGRL